MFRLQRDHDGHVGTYQELGEQFHPMIGRLFAWAGARSVVGTDSELIAIYHDNPEISEDDRHRTSIALSVPEGTEGEGEIGIATIAGGRYAIGHFSIDDDKAAQGHSDAWQYMYGTWLVASGCEIDDRVSYEVYVNNPDEHPERLHLIDIYVPIK